MSQDYKSFLAAQVLNENRMVSYRSLSRALKVHNNLAKRMLYEFHRLQNGKRPGSVHATYLLSGTRRKKKPVATNGCNETDGDTPMQSSPYMSSSMPNQDGEDDFLASRAIMLVAEEDLRDAKAQFENLHSIHVYSVESTSLPDLHVLTDVARELRATYAREDPLEYGKKYGVIQNKNVKRRSGGRPPQVSSAPVSTGPALQAKSSKPLGAKQESKSQEEPSTPTSDGKTTPSESRAQSKSGSKSSEKPVTKSGAKRSSMKRDSSNIFKAFAKAPPKTKRENTDSSAAETPADSAETSAIEDEDMKDPSEEEEDDEHYLDKVKKPSDQKPGKSRKEREEELRKIMDDDEPMTDAQSTEPAEEMTDVNTSQDVEKSKPEEAPVTVQGGRRRGRRQVKKKKTVKDEEGYLVTKEELVWESFSEDEPSKPKPAPSQATKNPGKHGQSQGNIMSFFGKK